MRVSVCYCCTSLIKCRCPSSTRLYGQTPIHWLMLNPNDNNVGAELLKTIDVVAPNALAAVDEYA